MSMKQAFNKTQQYTDTDTHWHKIDTQISLHMHGHR